MYTCNACCEASTQTNILLLSLLLGGPNPFGGGATKPDTGIIYTHCSIYVNTVGLGDVCRAKGADLCSELLGIYQLADHLEANDCSLSERTVFGNLAPVFGWALEVAMSPCLKQRSSAAAFTSLASKAALALKVFGATIFALQYPDFNGRGMEVSMLFVSTMVAYRLTQRYLLDRTTQAPMALLTTLDAIVAAGISMMMSRWEIDDLQQSLRLWYRNDSIVTMLILSFGAFSLGHFATLHLVKADTATATMVITNVSSGISVVQGVLFFNDSDFQRPLAFVGILLVILGGMWWTINQSMARYEPSELLKKAEVDAPEG